MRQTTNTSSMAETEKNEAITVVIEKLTEIVGEIDHVPEVSVSNDGQLQNEHTIVINNKPTTYAVEGDISALTDKGKEPTKVQPKVVTNQKGERTVILTTTEDSSDDKGERQVVLNFPVKVGNLNIENPEGLIQTLQNLNYALETGKSSSQKSTNSPSQGKKETFKCAKCDYSSHNKHYLKQHVELVHNAERPFKCPFCDYAGKRSHSLKEHLVVHSSYRPYECTLCNATFRKKGHLTNHVRMHSSKKTLNCSLCKQVFNEQTELHQHLREAHPSSNIYACDLCEYATTVKTNIIMHMHVHGNPKTFVCQTCNFVAVHTKIMTEHIQNIHDGNGAYAIKPHSSSKDGPVILMKCSQCGFTTDNRAVLTSHMWEHIDAESGPQENTESSPNITTTSDVGPIEDVVATTSIVGSTSTSPGNSVAKSPNKESKPTIYHCAQCNYSNSEAYVFITHMLSHKPNMPKPNATPEPTTTAASSTTDDGNQGKPFVHDTWAGVYRCSICSYTCELQRTIKAHIWKHIGNNDLDYPMFQNGPLSVYDDTPIGIPMLLGGKAPVATVATSAGPVANSQKITSPMAVRVEHVETTVDDIAPPVGMVVTVGGSPESASTSPRAGVHIKANTIDPASIMSITNSPEIDLKQAGIRRIAPGFAVVPASDAEQAVSLKKTDVHTNKLQLSQNSTIVMMSVPKRKPVPEDVEMQATAKKLRIRGESSKNVVVQEVSKVYTTPAFSLGVNSTSQGQSRSGAQSPQSTVSTSSSPAALNVAAADPVSIPSDIMKMAPSRDESLLPEHCVEVEVTAEDLQAVVEEMETETRGRQTAPDIGLKESIIVYARSDTDAAEDDLDDGRDADSDGSQKTGICKSLLAVIEQLRERSKSESEEDVGPNSKGGKGGKRRRSTPSEFVVPNDPDVPLDNNLNVEKVDGQFRCKLCHYTSPASALMTTHMRLHKAKKPSECSLCNYTAGSSEELQDHVLQHCKVRTYQCKLCTSSFSYKSQLRAHMRAHNERAPFSCIHCPFQTIDPVVFTNHGKEHLQTIHLCPTCGQKYDTKSELERHTQTKCRGKEVLKCDECDFTSINKESYRKHMRWHGKAYKCEKCEFSSTNYTEFKSHSRTHEEEQELKCDLCDFIASSTRSLKSHMKRHVNDQRFVQQPLEQYKCNMCGYVCHHLPSLKSHMWRHASEASYSYENTNEVINAAIDYDSRTEEEKKNKQNAMAPDCLVTFRCCQCGFETMEKSDLNLHMKSHMDIIKKTLEVNKGRVANHLLGSHQMSAEGDTPLTEETFQATESVKVTESGDANSSELSQ